MSKSEVFTLLIAFRKYVSRMPFCGFCRLTFGKLMRSVPFAFIPFSARCFSPPFSTIAFILCKVKCGFMSREVIITLRPCAVAASTISFRNEIIVCALTYNSSSAELISQTVHDLISLYRFAITSFCHFSPREFFLTTDIPYDKISVRKG